jgi:ornithine cyclodeaminase
LGRTRARPEATPREGAATDGAERGDLLLLREQDVEQLIRGHERELIDIVEGAYVSHAAGNSSLPHSEFLRFPDASRNRIIALPAFLGGDCRVAGVKCIASFPENVSEGMARASAIVVLNCARTRRLLAILGGARVSTARTADRQENLGVAG